MALLYYTYTNAFAYDYAFLITVAHSIMEAHGGNIGVFSEGEDSGGSVFYIDIPVSDTILSDPPVERPAKTSVKFNTVDLATLPSLFEYQSSDQSDSPPTMEEEEKRASIKRRKSIKEILECDEHELFPPPPPRMRSNESSPLLGEMSLIPPPSKSSKGPDGAYKLPPISLPAYEAARSPKSSKEARTEITLEVPTMAKEWTDGNRAAGSPGASSVNSTTSSFHSWMSPSPTPPRGSGKSILIVDDSSAIRKMAARLLKDMNTDNAVDHASDGKVAWEKIDKLVREGKREYDVIMMDYMVSYTIIPCIYRIELTCYRIIRSVDAKHVRSRSDSPYTTTRLQRLDRRCDRQLPAI